MTELSLNFRNRVTVMGLEDDNTDRCPTVFEMEQWTQTIAKKAAAIGFSLVRVENSETPSVRRAVFATAAANAEALRPALIDALDEVAFTVKGQDKKDMHRTYLLGLPALTTVAALRNS